MFLRRFFTYVLTSLYPESWPFWIKTGRPSELCKNAVLCLFRSVYPTRPQMRYSPLHFYFSDILYFMFYSVSLNLGLSGTKPVGLLPRASMQFSALVHPVQPTLSVTQLSTIFSFLHGCAAAPGSYGYVDYLCRPMALDYAVYAPWQPLLVHLHLTMRTLQPSHQRPSKASTPLQPPVRCSFFLLYFVFFFKASVALQLLLFNLLLLHFFRLFGHRGSVEI